MSLRDSNLLSPVDIAWLRMDTPDNPMVITALLRVDDLTVERLLAFLEAH
ncbi:MAG: hypothetical protein LPK85_01020 [Gammaproteobacteria bacterium]|nr:hypothetical protein [Gammaproteobacteria bacterium]